MVYVHCCSYFGVENTSPAKDFIAGAYYIILLLFLSCLFFCIIFTQDVLMTYLVNVKYLILLIITTNNLKGIIDSSQIENTFHIYTKTFKVKNK